MKWFWYVARNNELMMDLDGRALLEIAVKRLQRHQHARTCERVLPYHRTFVAGSHTADHYHLVIRLREPMEILERMVWQLYFMDHTYRSVKNLFRVIDDVRAPSLLISPGKWPVGLVSFWRPPDAICNCEREIHKNQEKIVFCPAHIKLRGRLP
jgi:hypothetical protein